MGMIYDHFSFWTICFLYGSSMHIQSKRLLGWASEIRRSKCTLYHFPFVFLMYSFALIFSTRFGAYEYPRDEALSSLYLHFAVDSDSALARIAEGIYLMKWMVLIELWIITYRKSCPSRIKPWFKCIKDIWNNAPGLEVTIQSPGEFIRISLWKSNYRGRYGCFLMNTYTS